MDPTELGTNRTGTQMSPRHFRKMQEGVDAMSQALDGEAAPASTDDSAALAIGAMRADYLAEAEPLGSVPVPGTLKGVAKAGMEMLGGNRMQALVDKLGERLAFERAGVRLYDAVIAKARIRTDEVAALSIARLEEIRNEEAEHFGMLAGALRELGADPTAQTPCADLAGIEGAGLMQAVTDPRTSVAQSLHALLVAELADDAGWELLVAMLREAGHEEMAGRFEHAIRQEAEHLQTIKAWYTEATLASGQVTRTARTSREDRPAAH